mmetsp:Transcript_9241/g.27834  ORF Transcript_9241/g.27834 Transcript_9241/m.27834 type:complete len:521 (+) Transcript_9241:106-1668(+)
MAISGTVGSSTEGGGVSSLCFVREARVEWDAHNRGNASSDDLDEEASTDTDDGGSSSISSDEDCSLLEQFRCNRIALGPEKFSSFNGGAASSAASMMLSGSLLASCHTGGYALLWDLGTRRIISTFGRPEERENGAPGMAVRRIGCSGSGRGLFLYQTRDTKGTVSIHDLECQGKSWRTGDAYNAPEVKTLARIGTNSRTFCVAAPCTGDENLIALPSEHECFAMIWDCRMDPSSCPAVKIHGAGLSRGKVNISDDNRKHGMLTSLALCATSSPSFLSGPGLSSKPVLACGMESGSVFFHDLSMSGRPSFVVKKERDPDQGNISCPISPLNFCEVKTGKEPVLALDLALSSQGRRVSDSQRHRSVIAVAGCAGDAAELCDLPKEERGTVAIIKASMCNSYNGIASTASAYSRGMNHTPLARIRTRVGTCEIGASSAGGKPGVSICRFRPDGRMFAVGGWDKRLRIFSRSEATPLAILKGHAESVTAVDWAQDAASSGLLATGGGDGLISLWRVFPHTRSE